MQLKKNQDEKPNGVALQNELSEMESQKFAVNNEDEDLDSCETNDLESNISDISSRMKSNVNVENSEMTTSSDKKSLESSTGSVLQNAESAEVCHS